MLTTILPIPILLSLLLATPLATSAATSKYGGTFEFCNGNNLVGPCVTQSFNYGTCYLVPDSNAKGDAGSSFQMTSPNEWTGCTFYLDNNCKKENDKLWPVYPGAHYFAPEEMGKMVVRSYQCLDTNN